MHPEITNEPRTCYGAVANASCCMVVLAEQVFEVGGEDGLANLCGKLLYMC